MTAMLKQRWDRLHALALAGEQASLASPRPVLTSASLAAGFAFSGLLWALAVEMVWLHHLARG